VLLCSGMEVYTEWVRKYRKKFTVWTLDGYEGRFLKWEAGLWRAFEHRNYRHWFSPAQLLTDQDIRVLRDVYEVSVRSLSDEKVVRMSPGELAKFPRKQRTKTTK
jgi:hypothetical protein